MAQLAIKGHTTRGKEVIEILEMLGGKNETHIKATVKDAFYYINKNSKMYLADLHCDMSRFVIYTLEEFLEKFPYKVGDKVASMEGYHGQITKMQWDECNCTVRYTFKDDECGTNRRGYTALMLCPYIDYKQVSDIFDKDNTMSSSLKTLLEEHKLEGQIIFGEGVPHKIELVLGDDFEIKVKDSKTFVIRKTPQYPKTYEECCKVLDYEPDQQTVAGYDAELIANLQTLKMCRDAYWKIVGEKNKGNIDYVICNVGGKIIRTDIPKSAYNHILAFPTKEMRDAFYENFKELIESCKELL